MRQPDKNTIKVAIVNGKGIYLKEFHQVYAEIKASIDDLAAYWGIPAEKLAGAMGIKNMGQRALGKCIENLLVNEIADDFRINVDPESFQKKLAETISRSFIDPTGVINIKAYQNYLNNLNMSIADYEENKEKEFGREMVMRAIGDSSYVTNNTLENIRDKKNVKKSFAVLKIPVEIFREKIVARQPTEKQIITFFNENKETYRVNEKRDINYIAITPEEYKKNISVDEELIEKFYEKNKSSLYRIPPKIKIKTILLHEKKKAEDVRSQVMKDRTRFDEFAKKHPGKITDYFFRGTHDPKLETVAFLKLKKTGDISEVVRTGRGFEIIKLEDRIPASFKPLTTVKKDIIKTLKNRKAVFVLRGDLEAVLRTCKTDKQIFEKFASEGKFKVEKTGWIEKSNVGGAELIDVLKQRAFGKLKRNTVCGYFVHRGKHVLFKIVGKKESFVPGFESIKNNVKEDLIQKRAGKLQAETVQRIKKELMTTEISMDGAAKRHALTVIKTPLLKIDGKIDSIKDAGDIVGEAFVLDDSLQTLEYKHGTNLYLVKLLKASKDSDSTSQAFKGEVEAEKMRAKRRNARAFVASLQRNAKISVQGSALVKRILK
jgi:hypothetical protein